MKDHDDMSPAQKQAVQQLAPMVDVVSEIVKGMDSRSFRATPRAAASVVVAQLFMRDLVIVPLEMLTEARAEAESEGVGVK